MFVETIKRYEGAIEISTNGRTSLERASVILRIMSRFTPRLKSPMPLLASCSASSMGVRSPTGVFSIGSLGKLCHSDADHHRASAPRHTRLTAISTARSRDTVLPSATH